MPRVRTDEPTVTSYALLGMLAIRPWSSYELAKAMNPTRGLGRMWPRARSHIYAEPKRLADLGLAEAVRGSSGRRPRTVYTITDAGRRALTAWLDAPAPAGPALAFESELMLKVFYADHASRAALLATLGAIRDWSRTDLAEHSAVARSYLLGTGPFPERAAVLALGGALLFEISLAVERWSEWAQGEVADWPDNPADAQVDWTVYERLAGHPPRPLRGEATPSRTPPG